MRRVNESVRQVLAEALPELKDPRIGLVTVTGVDTAPDLIATLEALFVREGLPAPDGELRNMIGGGARRLIERALERKNVKTSADEVEKLMSSAR